MVSGSVHYITSVPPTGTSRSAFLARNTGCGQHVVRVKCVLCGSTKGISYQELEGASGNVKAETCENCRGYVKILHQHKDPALDPVADDVASLGLDLLLRESGYRRGAVDPFLIGY